MGEKGTQTRDSLLDATQDLIETAGYFGTGLNTVIAAAGAPRGSLYFHFPGGKDQLVTEALRRGGQEVSALMREVAEAAPDTAAAVTGLLDALADRLEASSWRKGCPVATVALDISASSDTLREVCSDIYRSWESALAARLSADGHPTPDDTATAILALIEGALLLARVHQQREPLERVKRVVATLL
ncbi:transcriptional regulator, TetR family [Catenulispora acidiphila DSM 44928]|uniref:Transcriptional regulator, TetR family n=1 Tax=Catenulispora acidiphila (strain DSM 44928 / JCM 14897 / NBRC 102108 / NRRL B-24433 / ID139908) TaxID=479433 RepID=C7PY50_CATAD|nr:TetR/AcrR family transcriptional regulator [Catenulispora acidiphila]ACU73510.1 transcriptional regulator, TetR family [Catenulispora acidiphila DSM 44928]